MITVHFFNQTIYALVKAISLHYCKLFFKYCV